MLLPHEIFHLFGAHPLGKRRRFFFVMHQIEQVHRVLLPPSSIAPRRHDWQGYLIIPVQVFKNHPKTGTGMQETPRKTLRGEKYGRNESFCKPSSVLGDYLSTPYVAARLQRTFVKSDGEQPLTAFPSCFEWGLQGILRRRRIGELLPRLSILTGFPAVYFCCTILGVASIWRYQTLCSVKLGLSSSGKNLPQPPERLDFN